MQNRFLLFLSLSSLFVLGVFAASQAASELHEAILEGRFQDVEKILKEGKVDIEEKHESGQTPLMIACLNGDVRIFNALLAAGANESTSLNDYTLVHGAAYQGRNSILEILLKRGHPHTSFHPDGFAPIHRASWGISHGHTLSLDVLAANGADLNLPDLKDGNTPLMMAVDQEKPNMHSLGFLVGSGVDLDAKNKHGLSATMMASARKNKNKNLVFALVQAGANLNVTDSNGRTTREYVLQDGGLSEEELVIHTLDEDPRILAEIEKIRKNEKKNRDEGDEKNGDDDDEKKIDNNNKNDGGGKARTEL